MPFLENCWSSEYMKSMWLLVLYRDSWVKLDKWLRVQTLSQTSRYSDEQLTWKAKRVLMLNRLFSGFSPISGSPFGNPVAP